MYPTHQNETSWVHFIKVIYQEKLPLNLASFECYGTGTLGGSRVFVYVYTCMCVCVVKKRREGGDRAENSFSMYFAKNLESVSISDFT